MGAIPRAAQAAGYSPIGADLVDRRGDQGAFTDYQLFRVCNFLKDSPVRSAWSVVSNPPFHLIQEFCERAFDIALYKVAMLTPLRRLPAARWLQELPLESVLILSPRPSMPPASWITAGNVPAGGSQDFCWLIFNKQATTTGSPRLRWLCRDAATQNDEIRHD